MITHLLNRTALVRRASRVSDGKGGWTASPVPWPIVATVPFRVQAASANERAIAQQQQTRVTHVGYCDPGLMFKRDDQIEVDGLAYRVTGQLPVSIPGRYQKVQLEEIQRG
jgi:hypothetical protein